MNKVEPKADACHQHGRVLDLLRQRVELLPGLRRL